MRFLTQHQTLCAVLLVLPCLGWTATPAHANFIIDLNPGGEKFYNGDANKSVSSFTGTVGGEHSGPMVTVDTIGDVDTGAGFANIKPIKNGSLTQLTFTPADPTLFDDFSFRGQLLKDANGTVTVTVQDNQGDTSQTFTFTGLGKDADFDRVGIVAKSGSGETIKSVTLLSDFKEEKQNEFSFADGGGNGNPGVGVVPAPPHSSCSASVPWVCSASWPCPVVGA